QLAFREAVGEGHHFGGEVVEAGHRATAFGVGSHVSHFNGRVSHSSRVAIDRTLPDFSCSRNHSLRIVSPRRFGTQAWATHPHGLKAAKTNVSVMVHTSLV